MGLLNTITNLWRRPRVIGRGQMFYPIAGSSLRHLDYVEAFQSLPEVNSVINLKARCFANGKIKIVDKSGKEIAHRYTPLFSNPNWYQPISEFLRQCRIYREVFGNEFIYLLQPLGLDNSVKSIFTLPPDLMTCEYIDATPFFLHNDLPAVKYEISINNRKVQLRHEDILHLDDNRISIRSDQKDVLLGESKLQALAQPINNLYAAYKSRGTIMHRRGALGVLSNEQKDVTGSIPLLDTERDDIQNQYKKMYGHGLDQHQIIISSLPLRWQSIELDPRKLGLYEECREDFDRIMDAYGIPSELIVRQNGATYENQNQARKGFYQNVVIPEANEWIQAISSTLFEDDKATAVVDYSHLPIFQEDIKAKNEAMTSRVNYLSALYADKAISHAEYREELFKAGIGNGKPVNQTN